MKKLFLIVLIVSLLILCACADVSLKFTLTDSFEVTAQYDLSFIDTEENASDYIGQIGTYWSLLGFELTQDSDKNTLQGRKTIVLEDAKQASEQFASLITSDETIFYDVKFTFDPSFETDEYNLSASVSLEDVIRQSKAQGLSAEQVSDVLKSAADGSYTVEITLPGEVVTTNADNVQGNTCIWNIPFGQTRELLLHTKRVSKENLDLYAALNERAATHQTWLVVCLSAAAVLLIAAIVTLIIRRWRKRRASEVRVKQFR